jgi:dTDP-4-amino-4,6-dideoxygalactose transaminase
MSNICAGIGRGQMEVLDKHIALRRAMHAFYVGIFKNIPGVTVFSEPNSDYFSNHWLTCIVIDATKTNGVTSEKVRLALEQENIECRPLWKPMHMQPVFSNCLYFGNTVAENLFTNGLCLPSGSNLSENNRHTLSNAIQKVFTV